MTPYVELAITVVGFVALGATGYFYIRSAVARTEQTELAALAETRGERIADLEAHIQRLETRLAQLEGQMSALQALKAQEIAVEVARLLGDPQPR